VHRDQRVLPCYVSACRNALRAAAGVCDADDYCTGASTACTDKKKTLATVCRPSAGVCDVADKCDGKTNDCPADKYAATTVICRAAAGVCDAAEYCTARDRLPGRHIQTRGVGVQGPLRASATWTMCARGPARACPVMYKATGTVCKAASGDCDADDVCTGTSATLCPAKFQPKTLLCRTAVGVCDAE